MNLSNQMIKLFPLLYKNINRLGLLNVNWIQSTFISSYFAYKKYLEDSNTKFVKKFPPLFNNGHIIDIGANIGYTSYVFSQALSSSYKVFAFEPEENNVALLKKAASTYQFFDRLIITAAAVGEEEGHIELWKNKGSHADHRIMTHEFRTQLKENISSTQRIPLTTVDQFLKKQNLLQQPIAFIKIDVQGYELPVCNGMKETLIANPNCVVEFEYCPSIIKAMGYRALDLIQFFQNKNYLLYRLKKNGALKLLADEDFKLPENFQGYFDVICSLSPLTEES